MAKHGGLQRSGKPGVYNIAIQGASGMEPWTGRDLDYLTLKGTSKLPWDARLLHPRAPPRRLREARRQAL